MSRLLMATATAWALLGASPVWAVLDPNNSGDYPTNGGYGIIICGNSHVEYGIIDDAIKELLRQTYLTMVEDLNFHPNNVWVLVDGGNNVGNWTQGLFDDLPATKAQVASTFQTIGDRMWSDANTPRNLLVAFGGHGADGSVPTSMMVQLYDKTIYDTVFMNDCFLKINNNGHGGSPIVRLDVLATMCYSGGLIDDFRNAFNSYRGSTWPNAKHFSIVTAGDGTDITTGFLGVTLLQRIRGYQPTVDLDADGRLSIYEYFIAAAKADLTNPMVPYTPYIPDVIYQPSDLYIDFGYAEHPLYYEWNEMENLTTGVAPAGSGSVTRQPNRTQYVYGTQVTLTASPSAGYTFTGWTGDVPGGSSATNPITITMDANKTVNATFTGALTLGVSIIQPGWGSVAVEPSQPTYAPGTPVTLTATAGDDYEFVEWTGDVPGGHSTSNPLAITMNGDKSVTAVFTRVFALTVSEINDPMGSVVLDPVPNDSNHPRYRDGSVVVLTAQPLEGRVFKRWELPDPEHPGDANFVLIDANNPLMVLMDGDRQVTAVFGCSNGVGQALLLTVLGAWICGLAFRFMRRR